jgi:2',3'-cyclic-nucleotide 2'-phosphodiesterase
LRILFFGDIVGRPGRNGVKRALPELCERYNVELVGANVENAAGGFGVTEEIYKQLLEAGIDFMTSGNHIWDKKETVEKIANFERLTRPANFMSKAPGVGHIILEAKSGPLAVINLCGRIFMEPANSPFEAVEKTLAELPSEVKVTIIDFHAEATSEKVALGWFLDGRVSAVLGTHTHIPTADERVLPGGTAYLTDVGMCGPLNSVIGIKPEQTLERFITGIPHRFEVADGPLWVNAAVLDIDPATGKAVSIERVQKTLEN